MPRVGCKPKFPSTEELGSCSVRLRVTVFAKGYRKSPVVFPCLQTQERAVAELCEQRGCLHMRGFEGRP